LASTSAQYQRLVGKIELALGEGINGWVGMTMQPVILKDEAMNDPRFRYYPELEEEKFQSIMSVPIIAKDRHLIGVITLHTAAGPGAWAPDGTSLFAQFDRTRLKFPVGRCRPEYLGKNARL